MPADRPLVVAGIAGSLRRGSFNRGLLRAAVESAPGGMTIETLEIRDLPLYDADLDVDGGPEVVRAFKAGIREGGRGLDRHARIQLLDAGRAQERARLGLAGARARAQRQTRRDRRRDARALGHGPQPAGAASDADVPGLPGDADAGADARRAREHFDAEGNLTDDETRAQLVAVLEAFSTWIRQVS